MGKVDEFDLLGDGPETRHNWRAMSAGRDCTSIEEYPLFTDAAIAGQAECGPYAFLNTVPVFSQDSVQAAIVLRCRWYLGRVMPSVNWSKTDTSRYHGGDFPDEIAALVSLILGVRIRAGAVTRHFGGEDPLGSPVDGSSRSRPQLIRRSQHAYTLPTVVGYRSLDLLNALNQWPCTRADHAIALLRAARLYQDALWLAESEPSLSWLMLVSALETAAGQWGRKGTPEQRLRDSHRELCEYLRMLGEDALGKVAGYLAPFLGVTAQFLNFVMEFLPAPPPLRPNLSYQVDWGPDELRKALRTIYGYRSKALHEGTPFPEPMCLNAGVFMEGDAAIPEKPTGAMSTRYGVWRAEDTPMLLHTFEYIARGTLLSWWKCISENDRAGALVAAGR